jgi:hypothetical protein
MLPEDGIARGHGLPGVVGDRSTHNLWVELCAAKRLLAEMEKELQLADSLILRLSAAEVELRRNVRDLADATRQSECCCGERDCPWRHEMVRRLEEML